METKGTVRMKTYFSRAFLIAIAVGGVGFITVIPALCLLPWPWGMVWLGSSMGLIGAGFFGKIVMNFWPVEYNR